jgi:hypothetical protein
VIGAFVNANSLRLLSSQHCTELAQSFIKAGSGQPAKRDTFFGVTAPLIHKLIRQIRATRRRMAWKLERSGIHEQCLAELLFWVGRFDSDAL